MDPLTHAAAGVLISQVLPTPSRKAGALAGAVLAMLPDLDYLLVLINQLTLIRHHRGFTHSLIAIPLWALLAAATARALGGTRWFRPIFFLGLAALASHLVLDLVTSYGTQIFSPFSSAKLSLDWVFIIDPYVTGLLVLGAVVSWFSRSRSRSLGAVFLSLTVAYLLVCGLYHHQALELARRALTPPGVEQVRVAALPQPLSCRRWHLLAAGPEGIRQAFVQLPYLAWLGKEAGLDQAYAAVRPEAFFQAPRTSYRAPEHLLIHEWRPAPLPPLTLSPEAQHILSRYLEFARFPLLVNSGTQGAELVLTWLDLRFAVPGYPYPFVLHLVLDQKGGLISWALGRNLKAAPKATPAKIL